MTERRPRVTVGMGLSPRAHLYPKPPARTGLLLGYAGLSVTAIEAAVKILATCLRDN